MKTVMITGASRGLGLEFVRQYAADNWRVIATERARSPALDEVAALHPANRIQRVALDLADLDQIPRVAERLADVTIDVLINNAGYFGRAPFSAGGPESQSLGQIDYVDVERTLRINTLAPMRMAESFIEHVARSPSGRIISITSMLGSAGLNTGGGLYGYRLSKAALNAVVKSLSIDLLKRGVLAVALHPGWVQTEMGGEGAELTASESVRGMRQFIEQLTVDQLGRIYAWDGTVLPY